MQKLIGFGDHRTSNIVARIADEEVAHVAVGVFWFISVCQQMGRTPCTTFRGPLIFVCVCVCFEGAGTVLPLQWIHQFRLLTDLLEEYNVELKGPFNHLARDEAGFPREW